jgi:hypothetical protein
MESSQGKQTIMALERRLVKELDTMREKLTNLSLVMNDLKFMVEHDQRDAAQEIAAELIVRSRSR